MKNTINYQIGIQERDGERKYYYVRPESNDSTSFGVSMGKRTRTVSWKAYSENDAHQFVELRHYTPRHEEVNMTVVEGYTTEKGRDIERQVMVDLDMDEVRKLRDYLDKVLDAHQSFGKIKFAKPTESIEDEPDTLEIAELRNVATGNSYVDTGRVNFEGVSNLDVTKAQKELLVQLIGQLYAEPGFSDVTVADISGDNKSLRVIVGRLVQKGILYIDDGFKWQGQHMLYLAPEFYYLHNEWK